MARCCVALYDLKPIHASTLGIREGEKLLIVDIKNNDPNWWYAINHKGHIGYVPRSYVGFLELSTPELLKEINKICGVLNVKAESGDGFSPKHKTLFKNLVEFRDELATEVPAAVKSCMKANSSSEKTSVANSISECSFYGTCTNSLCKSPPLSPVKETKSPIFENDLTNKKKVVVSPKAKARSTLEISIAPAYNSTNVSTQTDCEEKEDILIPSELVPEMVEQIRSRTKLSYKFSILSVGSIFETLRQHVPKSSNLCTKILQELEEHRTDYKTIYQSQDKKRLREIFDNLWQCKNDQQQRSWPIYEDELLINDYLLEVNSILGDADPRICMEVIQSDDYDAVNTLVIYYQMEPRRTLRFSLLKVFESLCNVDEGVVEQLMMSVLPMELAREIEQHVDDHDRFKRCSKMLAIIFSFPNVDPPRNIYDFLNKNFVTFLLGRVESILDDETIDEEISNLSLTILLAMNIHFGKLDNIILDSLSEKSEATALTEKLMLLINREDDPIKVLCADSASVPNSVLKFMVDIFSLRQCAKHFYVNDIKVLLDIIVRQLTDLPPGTERRLTYQELLMSLIANTDYDDHRHQIDGISLCFSSILTEEDFSQSEKDIVTEIISTFPELFAVNQ